MSRRNRQRVVGTGFFGRLNSMWKRLPEGFRWNIEDTFLPENIAERLLPHEEPQLEIRLAPYRDILGHLVFGYLGWVLGLTTLIAAVLVVLQAMAGALLPEAILLGLLPFAILVVVVVIAIRERVEYNQWRLLKTNARIIISIPQPNSSFLVDNIELKSGINVIDTNWSRNPVWRVFQFFTGARDLYISLTGYRFVEGTARVGDALVIPDVTAEDVFALRKIVFTPQRPPKPQKVVFPSPQKVIVTEESPNGET